MGSQALKNIAEPMRVWRIGKNSLSAPGVPTYPFQQVTLNRLPFLISPRSRYCRSKI